MSAPAQSFGPYSPFRDAGDFVYVSGQTGVDVATMSASADVTAQADQAILNLTAVLAQAGLTLANVVKTTVFLTDMGDFSAINEVYMKHFPAPRPARSCVAVAELPRVADVPLRIEIEAVALKPKR